MAGCAVGHGCEGRSRARWGLVCCNRVGGGGWEELNGLFYSYGAKMWVLLEMKEGKIFGY